VSKSESEREWGAGTPSIETMVEVSLRIVDEHGFDALSTQRLAKELGVHRPNLYRRVANLEELHRHMVERIFDEAGVPDAAAMTDWRAHLCDAALRVWTAWDRYPKASPLLRSGIPSKPVMAFLESIFSVFLQGGFSDRDAEDAAQAYITFVFGAIAMKGITAGSDRVMMTDDERDLFPSVAEAQSRVITRERKPSKPLAPMLDGLQVVLDGVAARRVDR
jgi:AcrR family transcriptional regulator